MNGRHEAEVDLNLKGYTKLLVHLAGVLATAVVTAATDHSATQWLQVAALAAQSVVIYLGENDPIAGAKYLKGIASATSAVVAVLVPVIQSGAGTVWTPGTVVNCAIAIASAVGVIGAPNRTPDGSNVLALYATGGRPTFRYRRGHQPGTA